MVIEDLKASRFQPTELAADTAYGGDENHSHCLAEGIDLITPTPGKCPTRQVDSEQLTVADFTVEPGVKMGPWGREIPDPKCVACPAGLPPVRSFYDHGTEQIEILQFPAVCNACPLRDRCPTRDASGWKIVTISLKQVRLINRRRRERTDEFQVKYRKRSGIESTNSLLKRVTGLGRLRVRGRDAVFMSIYLKVAGWNVLRAAAVRSLIEKLRKTGQIAHLRSGVAFLTGLGRSDRSRPPPENSRPRSASVFCSEHGETPEAAAHFCRERQMQIGTASEVGRTWGGLGASRLPGRTLPRLALRLVVG